MLMETLPSCQAVGDAIRIRRRRTVRRGESATMQPLRNPVLPGCHPDPSVCRVGDEFFLVTSSFGYYPGIPVHRSTDLQHWELVSHVLAGPSRLDLEGIAVSDGVWAPTIRHHDGVFYVVYSVARQRRGVATYLSTATSAEGPWSPPMPLDAPGIDPSLFFDRDGRAWITAARDAVATDATGPGEIWMREFDPATRSVVGPEHILWHGALAGQWVEAPHVYERDGLYYLVGAEGGTERRHAVTAAVARHVTGPYRTDPRSPLLTHRHLGEGEPVHNVGHADIVDDPRGQSWALVLGVRPLQGHHTLGREVMVVKVDWEADGPVFSPGVGRVEGTESNAPDTTTRAPDWISLRGPVTRVWNGPSLTLDPAPESLSGTGVPAMIARRQDMHRFVLSCALDTTSVTEQRAGLVAFQTEDAWVAIRIERDASGAHAVVTQRTSAGEATLARAGVGAQAVLRIRSDGLHYDFAVHADGQTRVLSSIPHAALSTETAGGFVGVLVGAVNEGSAGAPPVTFTDVRYEALPLAVTCAGSWMPDEPRALADHQ